MENTKTSRNSSIEIMKILAIILIVLCHVVDTLVKSNQYITYSDYMINFNLASSQPRNYILTLMYACGMLGNNIFFVCSAWFLLDSHKLNLKKIWNMFFEVWVVSIIILIAMLLIRGGVSPKLIIKSLFPQILGNNWYITCYMLFYLLHTTLNSIINKMEQRTLLKVTTMLSFMYCGCNFIVKDCFFASRLIIWIAIYFVIAYMKKYMVNFSNSIKLNVTLLLFGIIGHTSLVFFTNFLGLHISFLSDKLMYWNVNCNPFLIIIAIALLNIGRRLSFKQNCINYISHLSLLIYIIHDNVIIRRYVRPFLWQSVYLNFGYKHLFLWIFIMVTGIFIASLILSILYEKTIQRFVLKTSSRIYSIVCRIYNFYEDIFARIN